MMRALLWLLALALLLFAVPRHWYPVPLQELAARWLGPTAYQAPPPTLAIEPGTPEAFCPPDPSGWRNAQVLEGVQIAEAATCVADNPAAVAAFVRGTNRVSDATLAASGLTPDAVVKGEDLDGDGDPDEIHIRLEVAELNGASPISDRPVTRYAIAPGVEPGLWVFAPKMVGMAVENFESQRARPQLRLPAPAIRVEQGDRIRLTLENSHYMPHTLHLHGADHGFVDAEGEGNDGVPITSEMPVMPGDARSYELEPRQTGTMFYHCHVQAHVHVMMGLQGLFIIEENRPNNWLQTLNVGAGLLRARSPAAEADFDREYDLHYQDLDRELSNRLQQHNDVRRLTKSMHRDYDVTDATQDYFLLNGRSFPYTFRESLVTGAEGDRLRLRVVNGGAKGLALHTHGHKFVITHRDGVAIPEAARSPQDVAWLATAQRLDLAVTLQNDGLHAYGPGIWPFHDHQNAGVTTDGIGPGGNISAIVYEEYLSEDGWPATQGVSWAPYFTEAYYRREVPVWQSYAAELFGTAGPGRIPAWRWVAALLGVLLLVGLLATRRARR